MYKNNIVKDATIVKNLENDIRLRRFDSLGNANVSDPRTYGIRASYNF